MNEFVTRDDTLHAEVLWTLKMNASHFCYRSTEDMGIIFRTMFPVSAIASHFSCGEQKASFIMCFGLAPHFKNILLRSLQEMSVYVLLFDKTYNHTTKDNRWTSLFVTGHSNCTTMYVTLVFIGQLVTLTICCRTSCRQLKTLISLRHCKCHWMV